MCGQHQLDVQAPELARQFIATLAGGEQALEQLIQHAQFERLGLTRAAATYAVLLLGDIGQVEELVEGACHG